MNLRQSLPFPASSDVLDGRLWIRKQLPRSRWKVEAVEPQVRDAQQLSLGILDRGVNQWVIFGLTPIP